jgi:preprotein translocase subunit SecF
MEFFKKRTSFRFMPLRGRWYAISGVLVLASVLLIAFRGLNLGIDFTGGVVLELSFPQEVDLDRVRGALVRLLPREGEDTAAVGQDVLEAVKSYDPEVQLRRTEVVGAQIGEELAEQGALAALFAFLMILAYVAVRFQWKLAVGSIIAALHDPILVLGFFAATQITFDLATLAAILAVVGYSLNDTVVVFDRIRERFLMTRKGTPTEIIDLAINDTLSRTLMTSVTTLIAVVSLLVFAGDTLAGFAIALFVGVLVGTYSSIFVASAVALDLKLTARDLMPVKREEGAVDDMP